MAKADPICFPFFCTGAPVLMIILLTFCLALTANQVKTQLDVYQAQPLYYCSFNCSKTENKTLCEYKIFEKNGLNITVTNDCAFCAYKNGYYFVSDTTNKILDENPVNYPGFNIAGIVLLSLSIIGFCICFLLNVVFWMVLVFKFGTTSDL